MTLRSSDLESDSDLDSIRNSCDVFTAQTAHCALKTQFLFDGSLNLGRNHCIFFRRHGNVSRLHTRGKGTSQQNAEKNENGIQKTNAWNLTTLTTQNLHWKR